jgi:hypothetical protein
MGFCPQCGLAIPREYLYCPRCGVAQERGPQDIAEGIEEGFEALERVSYLALGERIESLARRVEELEDELEALGSRAGEPQGPHGACRS